MPELTFDRSRTVRFSATVCAVVALAGIATSLTVLASGVDDLRGDIPTVEAIHAEIERIADDRQYQQIQLDVADARLTQRRFERDHLDDESKARALEISELSDMLRAVATETYIIGGNTELEFVADVAITNDLLWRHHLMSVHTAESEAALQRLTDLRASLGAEQLTIVDEIASLRSEIGALRRAIRDLNAQQARVSADLPLAEAWDYAADAVDRGAWGIAPADGWAKLRFCESSDDYSAISPSGEYRGAYQFDIETWQSVGGSGDPAAAPPSEQDARARALYALRGHEPWPVCGAYLR